MRKSLNVDDISFDSTSELSYTIKNLDIESIIDHRRGNPTREAKRQERVRSPETAQISLKSSVESRFMVDQKKETKVESDDGGLSSDGESTLKDFVPREVAAL